jgi:hypothetical protein
MVANHAISMISFPEEQRLQHTRSSRRAESQEDQVASKGSCSEKNRIHECSARFHRDPSSKKRTSLPTAREFMHGLDLCGSNKFGKWLSEND